MRTQDLGESQRVGARACRCDGRRAAYAQNGQTNDQATTVTGLVVTAQKREQRLQDVPVVVTVANEQLLKDAGVADIRQLSILTPGLTVTATSNESSVTARIRGVGTVGDNPGLESSVGVVVDGVYRPRNGVGFGDLGPVERIEVLKGPQGTLFGKNTSAGVINIITKEPSYTPEIDGELTTGNYGAIGSALNFQGALVPDKVAGGLYVAARRRDGFMNVETLGSGRPTDDYNQSFYTVRGQILALPNERFTGRVIADYTERNENCCTATQLYVGTQASGPRARGLLINDLVPGSLDLTSTPFDRLAYSNRSTAQHTRDYGLSGEINYDLGGGLMLTSLTAVRGWRLRNGQDLDFTAADLIYRPDDGTTSTAFDQYSQELRLAGQNGKLTWLAGAFYAREDLDSNLALRYGKDFYNYFDYGVLGGAPALLGLTPGTIHQTDAGSLDTHRQKDTSFALFTNNDYAFTDKLTGTLGLRYTSDRKNVVSTFQTTGGSCQQAEPAYNTLVSLAGAEKAGAIVGGLCVPFMNQDYDALGPITQSSNESEVTGTAKLAYRFNPQAMAYGSYSRGYKAGGFNLDRKSVVCPPVGTPTDGSVFIPDACLTSGGALANTHAYPDFAVDPNTYFAPETVNSFEIGAKTQWLDDSLSVNGAVFYQTFQDFQLNTFVGTQFIVESLPKVISKGADLDVLWITPMTGLRLQGGVTYDDTTISTFTASDLSDPSRFSALSNLPGQTLSFAPKWSGSIAATYERPISETLMFRGNITAKTNSKYNTGSDLHAVKEQPAFTLVNARVGIGSQDERWTLELWGENIFNQDYIQVAFNGPFQVASGPAAVSDPQSVYDAFLGAPRTFGVTLRTKLK